MVMSITKRLSILIGCVLIIGSSQARPQDESESDNEEGGAGKILRDDVHLQVVLSLEKLEERPAGARDDGLALQVLELADLALRVDQDARRVVLENRRELHEGQTLLLIRLRLFWKR